MLVLAINTATPHNEIALLDGGKVLFEKTWLSKKDEGEKLLPMIKKAFEKNKKQINELRKIFVVAGPGSFTGLRIGVSIANALAFSLKIPVFSCNNFEYLKKGKFFGKGVKQVHPVYLKKPYITKSKKPVFIAHSS